MAGSIYAWSTTAASNATADGDINWAEGMAPSAVNNSSRQEMGRVAEWRDDIGGVVTVGGTANAITVTANSAFTTYANGRTLAFVAASTNTGGTSLNVNSIGAKAIRIFTEAGETNLGKGGELQAGGVYRVTYNTALNSGAGGWLLHNPSRTLRSAFHAHKNGTDQTGIVVSTDTKVTFTTEFFDSGFNYDATNSRWTPPAGIVSISATVTIDSANVTTGNSLQLYLYKDGVSFKRGDLRPATSAGANHSLNLNVIDSADGTNYYEIYANLGGTGDKTIEGTLALTYFSGVCIG